MRNWAIALILLGGILISFAPAGADEPPACTDTDGGFNYAVKGTVIDPSGSYTDYCESSRFLKEYYCVRQVYPERTDRPDVMNQLAKDCEYDGGTCSDGICVYGGATSSSTTSTTTTTASSTTTTISSSTTTTLTDSSTTTTTLPDNVTTTTTAPPQNPAQNTGGSPGTSGGSGIRGIVIPLKEDFIFVNPPEKIFASSGEEVEFGITITNVGNKKTSVNFSFSGAPAEWFSVSPENSNLSAGESTTYKIKLTPLEAGSYDVNVSVYGIEETKNISLSMEIEAPATSTTTITNIPATTTTTSPPSGITGAILFVSNNPLVTGAAALVVILGGSIWWSLRAGRGVGKIEEEKIAEKQEPSEKTEQSQ